MISPELPSVFLERNSRDLAEVTRRLNSSLPDVTVGVRVEDSELMHPLVEVIIAGLRNRTVVIFDLDDEGLDRGKIRQLNLASMSTESFGRKYEETIFAVLLSEKAKVRGPEPRLAGILQRSPHSLVIEEAKRGQSGIFTQSGERIAESTLYLLSRVGMLFNME